MQNHLLTSYKYSLPLVTDCKNHSIIDRYQLGRRNSVVEGPLGLLYVLTHAFRSYLGPVTYIPHPFDGALLCIPLHYDYMSQKRESSL